MQTSSFACSARGTLTAALFGLLGLAAGCGGRVDPSSGDGTRPPYAVDPPAPEGSLVPVDGTERLADGLGTPSAIALSDDAIVFTTRATKVSGELVQAGAVFVQGKRVGEALMIALDGRGASYDALAVDGDTAFVATNDGRVLRVPLTGGESTAIAAIDAGIVALAPAGEHVYFASEDGAMWRAPRAGGKSERLGTVEGRVRALSADDTRVYAATVGASGRGAIVRVTPGDAKPKVLSPSGTAPCAMIRAGRELFWTSHPAAAKGSYEALGLAPAEDAAGSVLRLSVDGGEVVTVASGAFEACALASDGASLYFATTSTPQAALKRGGGMGVDLMRAPLSGGPALRVASATQTLTEPGAVAVDATHLYWLTEYSVFRLRTRR